MTDAAGLRVGHRHYLAHAHGVKAKPEEKRLRIPRLPVAW